MSKLLEVATGWTGRLGPFILRTNGTPLPLTGLTVALILRKRESADNVADVGSLTPDPDQVTNKGQLSWDPSVSTLADVGVYEMRFKVTDGSGKVVYFPNGVAAEIAVWKA